TGKPRLGLSGELRTAHDHGNLGYTLSSAASTLFGREPSPQLCTLSAALHYSRVSSNFFARQWHAALACAGFGSGVTPNETRDNSYSVCGSSGEHWHISIWISSAESANSGVNDSGFTRGPQIRRVLFRKYVDSPCGGVWTCCDRSGGSERRNNYYGVRVVV